VVRIGCETGEAAARIRLTLEKSGKLVGPMDLLIAATALEQGAVLVTHNVKEFRRVRGLRVEDW
jgi:tRNA(fMet)-specific endonuclease VapC